MVYIEEEKIPSRDERENPCKYCYRGATCDFACSKWRESFKLRWAKITAYGEKAIPIFLESQKEGAALDEQSA